MALTKKGKMLMVQQYRHSVGATTLEFPSGYVDKDEMPEDAIKRELEEETGFICDRILCLGSFKVVPSRLKTNAHIFIGFNAKKRKLRSGMDRKIKTILITGNKYEELVRKSSPRIDALGISFIILLRQGLLNLRIQNIRISVVKRNQIVNKSLDIVLINPGDKRQVYQGLAVEMAAVEPPYWIAAIAGYLREKGFAVAIIDASAENLSPDETSSKVSRLNPLLAAVIVYGSQPSASTQNMTSVGNIIKALRSTSCKIAVGGLHPSALPERTLVETRADFLIEGEGPYTLECLLSALKKGSADYSSVPGLWFFL